GADEVFSVLDLKTGTPLKLWDRLAARTAAFEPGGRLVAVAHGTWLSNLKPLDPFVKMHDLDSGRVLSAVRQEHVVAMKFSPDGRTLACIDSQGVTLWELASGKERLRIASADLRNFTFSPDGRRMAIADWGQIYVHDVFGKAEVTFTGHEESIQALAF